MRSTVLLTMAATLLTSFWVVESADAAPTILKTTNAAQTVDDFVIWDNLNGANIIMFESQANGGQVWLNGAPFQLDYTPTATYIRIYLIGGSGNDTVMTTGVTPTGRSMSVYVHLEAGDDNFSNNAAYTVSVYGGDGNDLLEGGPGTDLLRGENGNDVLRGFGGDDYLNGGDGDDDIEGGAGNDLCIGGAGSDVINGQSGDDTLVGGVELAPGVWGPDYTLDLLEGSLGADVFYNRFYKKTQITLKPIASVRYQAYKARPLTQLRQLGTQRPEAQLHSWTYTVEEDTIVDFSAVQGDTKVSQLAP